MLQLIFTILFNMYLCYSSSVAPFNVVPQTTLLSVLRQLPVTNVTNERRLPLKTEVDWHRLLNTQMLLILVEEIEAIKSTEIAMTKQVIRSLSFLEKIGVRVEILEKEKQFHVTLNVAGKLIQIILSDKHAIGLERLIDEIKDGLPWDAIELELRQCYNEWKETKEESLEIQQLLEKRGLNLQFFLTPYIEECGKKILESAELRYEAVLNETLKNLETVANQSEITILQSFTQAYLGFQAQTDAMSQFNQFIANISEPK